MGTASSSHNSERAGRLRWLWFLPRLAFLLFVGGVALLLWHCGESQLAASTFARALERLAPASEDARARTSDCLEQMVEELRSRGDLAASDSAASAWVAYAEAALGCDDPRHARARKAARRPAVEGAGK